MQTLINDAFTLWIDGVGMLNQVSRCIAQILTEKGLFFEFKMPEDSNEANLQVSTLEVCSASALLPVWLSLAANQCVRAQIPMESIGMEYVEIYQNPNAICDYTARIDPANANPEDLFMLNLAALQGMSRALNLCAHHGRIYKDSAGRKTLAVQDMLAAAVALEGLPDFGVHRIWPQGAPNTDTDVDRGASPGLSVTI
jgi:hypothetical protein